MRNLTLDINALALESFGLAEDPMQSLAGPPPTEGCEQPILARTTWTYGTCCA
jgi:hypothetical protein